MIECWKHGVFGCFALGEHFVLSRRTSVGSTVYGVWVLRTRNRGGQSEAELLAEFRSKLFAKRWARRRNETIKRPR